MHEYVIHLHKDENHIKNGIGAGQNCPGNTRLRNLEESQKLQTGVDQGAEPEKNGTDPQNQRTVTFVVFGGHQFDCNKAMLLCVSEMINTKLQLTKNLTSF